MLNSNYAIDDTEIDRAIETSTAAAAELKGSIAEMPVPANFGAAQLRKMGVLPPMTKSKNSAMLLRLACSALRSFRNIALLEWSEACLLQMLCPGKTLLEPKSLRHSQARRLVDERAKWCYELVELIQHFYGPSARLQDILAENRARKFREYGPDCMGRAAAFMFVTRHAMLSPNGTVLRHYKVSRDNSNVHRRRLTPNIFMCRQRTPPPSLPAAAGSSAPPTSAEEETPASRSHDASRKRSHDEDDSSSGKRQRKINAIL